MVRSSAPGYSAIICHSPSAMRFGLKSTLALAIRSPLLLLMRRLARKRANRKSADLALSRPDLFRPSRVVAWPKPTQSRNNGIAAKSPPAPPGGQEKKRAPRLGALLQAPG